MPNPYLNQFLVPDDYYRATKAQLIRKLEKYDREEKYKMPLNVFKDVVKSLRERDEEIKELKKKLKNKTKKIKLVVN